MSNIDNNVLLPPDLLEYVEELRDGTINWQDVSVKASHGGSGAFGSGVERVHDIRPNNRNFADYKNVELKSSDMNLSDASMSWFSKNPPLLFVEDQLVRKRGANPHIWRNFAYQSMDDGKRKLYIKIAHGEETTPILPAVNDNERHSFTITSSDIHYQLAVDGSVVAGWEKDELEKIWRKKVNNTAYYEGGFTEDGHCEIRNVTLFWEPKTFEELFTSGEIHIDSRLSERSTKPTCRDHGTAFRSNKLDNIFLYSCPVIKDREFLL